MILHIGLMILHIGWSMSDPSDLKGA